MARRNRKSRNANEDKRGSIDKAKSTTTSRAASRLIQDAGSIAFTWPTGSSFSLRPERNPYSDMVPLETVDRQAMPGVIGLYTVPVLGKCASANDAATIAARSVYSFVRHANSGHANYDAPDYMMYVMSMDSIMSFYAWMVRVYGVLRNYSQINLYTPESILSAMGVDANALSDKISDLRSYINVFAAKASAFCIPNVFSYFQKHFDLYSNVYMDDRSARGQFYVFNPYSLLKYNEVSGKGQLDILPVTAVAGTTAVRHNMGLPEIKGIGDTLLNAVLASEDMGIMSGDTLKAYGDSGLIKFSQIAEDYVVTPVYDELMLNKIANIHCVFASGSNYADSPWVTQSDEGVIVCHPTLYNAGIFVNSKYLAACSRVVRSMIENPTPDQVVEFTAFTTIADASDGDGSSFIENAGDTLVVKMEVTYWGHTQIQDVSGIPYYSFTLKQFEFDNLFDLSDRVSDGVTEALSMISKFAWHPLVYMVVVRTKNPPDGDNSHYVDIVGFEGDMDNYAIVGSHALEKIHNARIMDELSVPLFGVG